jgi:hypothetical protein
MHERGGLERLTWLLLRDLRSSQLSQLLVHQREQLVGLPLIP